MKDLGLSSTKPKVQITVVRRPPVRLVVCLFVSLYYFLKILFTFFQELT